MLKLRAAAVIAALLLSAPATADEAYGIRLPPLPFSHGPFIAMPHIVHQMEADLVDTCWSSALPDPAFPTSAQRPEACVVFHKNGEPVRWDDRGLADTCVIYIAASQIELLRYPAIIEHEMGHCRGWPPDHP